jgi:hypothetical protein
LEVSWEWKTKASALDAKAKALMLAQLFSTLEEPEE